MKMISGVKVFVLALASTVALAGEKVYEINRTPIQMKRGECVTLKAHHYFPIKANEKIKWQKYAEELRHDGGKIIIEKKELTIKRLIPTDSALYQASIQTKGGKEITRNWLTIKDCDIHEKQTRLTDECTVACEAKCDIGWHYYYSKYSSTDFKKGDTCFKYFSSPKTWEDANTFCQSKKAQLATIFDEDENSFVGNLLKTGDGGWIGLNDKSQESSYIWNYRRDPAPKYFAWDERNHEPNNNNRGCNVENCVELKFTTKKWNDAVCNAHFGFVCQIYSKVDIPGWNCTSGKCYKYDPLQVAWDEARTHCMNMNATLVTITSSWENNYVASFKEIKRSIWIGLNDRAEAGTYVWNDVKVNQFQQKATYFNWDTGEPNDKLYNKLLPRCTGEDCAQIKKWNGSVTWSDLGCNTALPFVCEKRKDAFLGFAAWIAITMGAGLVISIVAARGYMEYKSKRGKKEFKALISNATRPVQS